MSPGVFTVKTSIAKSVEVASELCCDQDQLVDIPPPAPGSASRDGGRVPAGGQANQEEQPIKVHNIVQPLTYGGDDNKKLSRHNQIPVLAELLFNTPHPNYLTVKNYLSNVIPENQGWLSVTAKDNTLLVSVKDRWCSRMEPMSIYITADCIYGLCNCQHHIANILTQLLPCRIFYELFLTGETDPDWEFILDGVLFGFKIMNPSCTQEYNTVKIYRDNYEHYQVISNKLREEIRCGRISRTNRLPTCSHNPFVIPKTTGGFRTIIDCSRPLGKSVNNFVSEIAAKFSYKSLDHLINSMCKADYISITDIQDAYRAVSIHPSDRIRQGIPWDFGHGIEYLLDNRLCMGLSSSPYIFTKISDFIARCANRAGVNRITNYLDDFAIVGGTFAECADSQRILIALIRKMGFTVNYNKITSPSQEARFLGIIIDTIKLQLQLPPDKIIKLKVQLDPFLTMHKASRKQLEQLAGRLAHCSTVVRGGRSFTSRIYDAIRSLKKPFHRFRINAAFRDEILWWHKFIDTFNGLEKILGIHAPIFSVYTDASNFGFGAIFGLDWCTGAFMEDHHLELASKLQAHIARSDYNCANEHINVKEMWAVMAAAYRWGPYWADHSIIFVTDNTTVRAALCSGRSPNKLIMGWLKELFWLSCQFNFNIDSTHIRTHYNTMCDALSRLDRTESFQRLLQADPARLLCCLDSLPLLSFL